MIARDFERAYDRRPQRKQLDWMVRVVLYARRSVAHEGGTFTRSVPQIVRGLGLAYDGSTRHARARYRNQLANTLGYLQAMGYLDAREPLSRADGRGRGWRLTWTPAGRQAMAYGPRRRARRTRGGGEVRPAGCSQPVDNSPAPEAPRSSLHPPTGSTFGRSSLRCSERLSARERAPELGPFAAAALAAAAVESWEGGSGDLDPLLSAARAGAPPVAVAVAAWRAVNPGKPWKLGPKWREQLGRSTRQLDRLHGRQGAGAELLVHHIAAIAEHRAGGDDPHSIAYFVAILRGVAREEKRRRRHGRSRPLRGWKPRADVF